MSETTSNPTKALLRKEMYLRISDLSLEEKTRQSKIVCEKVINHPFYKSSKRIGLFMSTEKEIDTSPIIVDARAKGAAVFVPQCIGGAMKMLKLEIGDEETMVVSKPGVKQHGKKQLREDALKSGGMDLLIIPGVAFSRAGSRLGHGSGYYDRFIRTLRKNPDNSPKVIAVAFQVQVVDKVPMTTQDQIVDDVLFAE